jgi:hypothetical protein
MNDSSPEFGNQAGRAEISENLTMRQMGNPNRDPLRIMSRKHSTRTTWKPGYFDGIARDCPAKPPMFSSSPDE